MNRLLQEPGVYQILLDMCRFGLRATSGPYKDQLVKKPTMLVTNIAEMAAHVSRLCDKGHEHGQLIGGAASGAAIYTPAFVKAILRGIKAALGIKADTNGLPPEAVQKGKAMGQAAYLYAKDQVELEEEFQRSYATSSYPTEFGPLEEDQMNEYEPTEVDPSDEPRAQMLEPPEHDAVEDVRRELRRLEEQPRIAKALEKVDDFSKTDDGQFALAPALRREVHRLHRNLGHPAPELFLRALKNSGVRSEILRWTKDHFRCATCASRAKPSPARPGHLMRSLEFNQVVGVDLCFLPIFGREYILLHALCWGTNYQQASLCQNKSADEVLRTLMDMWVKVFGPPELLVMDRGKEFFNEKFHAMLGGQGCGLHYIDAESPWQNSRTERAGGILKEKILATAHEVSATPEELHLVIAEAVSARNRFMNRFGFSPMQRVFGKNLRIPDSMLTSDSMDQELLQASVTEPVRRLWEIQDIATKEWVRRQDQEAIRRSIRAKTRTSDMKSLAPGSWISETPHLTKAGPAQVSSLQKTSTTVPVGFR